MTDGYTAGMDDAGNSKEIIMFKTLKAKVAALAVGFGGLCTQAVAVLPADVNTAMGETKGDVVSAGGLILIIAAAAFGIMFIVRMLK